MNDHRTRREVIGQASLQNLRALRERLLPDLEELATRDPASSLDDLEVVLARHSGWLRDAFQASYLPAKILRSNIAAFAASAIDIHALAMGQARSRQLWHEWFLDPASPLRGTIKGANPGTGGGRCLPFWRTICCLRDAVAGAARCASCPRRKEAGLQAARGRTGAPELRVDRNE